VDPLSEEAAGKILTAANNALVNRIDRIAGIILDEGPKLIKKGFNNGKLIVDKGLPNYLRSNYSKCETIRTLLKRDDPVLIENVYVSPQFIINHRKFNSESLLRLNAKAEKPVVVTGPAGCGKSVFLKWSFRQAIEQGHTYYPVFFEIRSIPTNHVGGLLDAMFNSIASYSEGFTRDQFNFGLNRGLFYLMIDALDEASISLRDGLSKEIFEIHRKYPKCPLLVTSRPNIEFGYWEGFTEAHLQPFDKKACIKYISKIEFDAERKKDFLEAIERESLFESHGEFLSNALLASMMLLTYDELAEIPERRHIFYKKCFDVLVREHDFSKGKYRRNLESRLDHTNIERVFQIFCTFSYLDSKYEFSMTEFRSYLSDALQYCDLKADLDALIHDYCESISVIQRDGDYFEFIHRSFQEYFYARFCIMDTNNALVEKALEVFSRGRDTSILDMVYDMDPDKFCFQLTLPVLKGIRSALGRIDARSKPDLALSKFCTAFGFRPSRDGTGGFSFYFCSMGEIEPTIHLRCYIMNHSNKRQAAWWSGFEWQGNISYADFFNKLREIGVTTVKTQHVTNGIEIAATPQNRGSHKTYEVDAFLESVSRALPISIKQLETTQLQKKRSLASRMRTRKATED
jgi:hypothetical protein